MEALLLSWNLAHTPLHAIEAINVTNTSIKAIVGITMILRRSEPQQAQIRVGGEQSSVEGPSGTSEWQRETLRRHGRAVTLYYQEIEADIIEEAVIRVHDGVEIQCHRATEAQLQILDATFSLVPPSHLRLVNQRKPRGFLVSSTAGLGNSRSYMGGLNPGADYRDTPLLNERQLIIITHGALWRFRELGVCPTVLHEIGHVMTHRGEISYLHFPEERRRALESSSTSGDVSRSRGREEALCNAYMYFLCYAAPTLSIQRFGDARGNPEKDRITREGLRGCQAFGRRMLNEEWRGRFEERVGR
jgi:hypothetical protein